MIITSTSRVKLPLRKSEERNIGIKPLATTPGNAQIKLLDRDGHLPFRMEAAMAMKKKRDKPRGKYKTGENNNNNQ
jgi:hypothetical protein